MILVCVLQKHQKGTRMFFMCLICVWFFCGLLHEICMCFAKITTRKHICFFMFVHVFFLVANGWVLG